MVRGRCYMFVALVIWRWFEFGSASPSSSSSSSSSSIRSPLIDQAWHYRREAHLGWDLPFFQPELSQKCRVVIALKLPIHGDTIAHLRKRFEAGAFLGPNMIEIPSEHVSTLVQHGIAQSAHCLPPKKNIPNSRKQFKTLNMYSRAATQSGRHGQTPLSAMNLNGQGQVIAVADTGIDYDMCFFKDKDVAVPIDTVDLSHRKIVTYNLVPEGSFPMQNTGHGTHTAASIAGEVVFAEDPEIERELGAFDGMAPAAKLALYDLGEEHTLRIADLDLYEDLFRLMYERTPARISSNSWGAPVQVEEVAYDQYAMAVDKFTNENPDFLTLFGAGNWGSTSNTLYQTIGTPALAKNALTVGSCTSFAQSFENTVVTLSAFIRVMQPEDNPAVTGLHTYVQAKFGPELISLDTEVRFVVNADPPSACTPLKNAIQLEGAMVLIYRAKGNCSLAQRTLEVQKAKGKVAIFVSGETGVENLEDHSALAKNASIPSIGLDFRVGSAIAAAAMIATAKVVVKAPAYDERAHLKHNFGFVSDFSSRGPTIDGRIKPDIMGPGEYITSAKSDNDISSNQCKRSSLTAKKGTSMATPIVAGNVAQLRQYLVDGWYPSGRKTPTDSIASPSAALMKAMVINSGVPLKGWVDTNNLESIDVDLPPSNIQGYGRLQLDRVLRFADQHPSTGAFDLKLYDNVTITTSSFRHYCINVTDPDYPLKITLVWSDFQADLEAEYLLVNNLDLFASNVGQKQHWFGNHRTVFAMDETEDQKESCPFIDAVNNVEQIDIGQPPNGLLGIHIRGGNVPEGPQPFALVITGRFEDRSVNDCTGPVICPSNCSGNGECLFGLCKCSKGYAGVDCSSESRSFPARGEVTDIIELGEWSYFHTDLNETIPGSLVFDLKRLGESGDPDLFVAHEQLPSFEFSHWLNMSRLADTEIVISKEQLKPGRYYIGVHAACCEHTQFVLSFHTTADLSSTKKDLPIPQSSYAWPILLLVLSLGIVLSLALFVIRDMTGANAHRYAPVGGRRRRSDRQTLGRDVSDDEDNEYL